MFKKEDEEKNNPFKNENLEPETIEETEENNKEVQEEEKENSKTNESKLQAELDDLSNKYLRLAADFDNFRKRQMQERESLLKYGAEDTLKKIITVLDTFERAQKSVSDMSECDKIKESYNVGIKQLYDTLDKIGLKKIEAKGTDFDPNLHEAVMQTPTNDYPPHTVIDELQTGYKLFDKVLRPVFVNVATEAPEENNENEQKEE